MSTEDDVRAISRQFYAALNRMANGDATAMEAVWSHEEAVTALHPIGDRQVGWEAVRESFEAFARLASDGEIELKDPLISVEGALAYEVGLESGSLKLAGEAVTFEHRATNIYRRTDGAWQMTHHHADLSPAIMAVLDRLSAA